MRVLAVMAHFDPEGVVAPHVRRHIAALGEVARVVVVSTAALRPKQEEWLRANAELVRRENHGYDFFSYREGLLNAGGLESYDSVVVCNDSFVGPLLPYRGILAEMAERPVDFWGLTRSAEVADHVQSFFLAFTPRVASSPAFTRFWQRMTPLSDRGQVILRYELGLSKALRDAGFACGSYFAETAQDRQLARRRVWWRAWLRTQEAPRGERRELLLRRGREAWNPCIGLADRALEAGRLPLVKIDTLRYDPYRLDARRLLAACVRERPDLFADVPDYLERTSRFYPVRPNERLPDPWPLVRPLRRLVRYA